MYLFSRSRVAHPATLPEAIGFAAEITAKATQIAGTQVEAWMSVLSAEANTVTWTAWFEHLADWETAMDKLGADPG